MPNLIIQRKNEIFNSFLPFNILLNGKRVGSLASGEHHKWEIPVGNYELQVSGGFVLKSQRVKFNLKENTIKLFSVGSFGKGYVKSFLQLKEMEF